MSEDVNKRALKEVVLKANTGADAIQRAPIVDRDTGIRCLRTGDINNNKPFSQWGFCEITEQNYERFQLLKHDILIARTGAIGEPYFIEKDMDAVFNNGIMRIRVDEAKCFPKFIYFCLKNPHFIEHVKSVGTGSATRPNIKMEIALGYQIPWVNKVAQRKIASILSAYDDLIENNTRRIAILEEMAQAIYREWFVNFRFPGHENVKLVDSPLGQIPEGWEVLPLFDIAKVNYGKNLPTKQLDDSAPFPVYGAAKIIGRYTEFTRNDRTLICGCRGSVGEMQITLPQCFVTNNSFTFDLDEHSFFWLYHTLMWRGLRDVVSGSAQPQITLKGISSVQLSTPPEAARKAFHESLLPLFELKFCLENKNSKLRNSRDLLLPKLISGKLDVEDLDIDSGLTAEALEEATA